MIVVAFYKFVTLKNVSELREQMLTFCKNLGIKGRILLGTEGINGSVAGTREQMDAFQAYIREDARFSDIVFKEQEAIEMPFKRMNIKIKDEIVRFGVSVDLSKTGTFLAPEKFLESCEDKNTIILDTRNDYEWNVGKFKNAITLPIKTFREFPHAVEKLGLKKDAKIAMYCTGGIRCEKASAYMAEQGFTNVSQLEGGILAFGKACPDTTWEGSCFVFDKRLISQINEQNAPITKCESCETSCDLYRNCNNVTCDRYVILCASCKTKLQGCCSEACFNESMKRVKKGNPELQAPQF